MTACSLSTSRGGWTSDKETAKDFSPSYRVKTAPFLSFDKKTVAMLVGTKAKTLPFT